MAEKFYFDFHQIPHVGVPQPDMDDQVRADGSNGKTVIRRPFDMRISNFGSLDVANRFSWDYTRTNTMSFKAKGESEDINVLTEDTGIGQNVKLFGVSVNHNPHIWGDSIKYVRDDQFIRMTMSRDTGTSTAATEIDPPAFDVMDTKESTAEGIAAVSNSNLKNWPSEGWRSFGGKYDFLPYSGGWTK
jgi:hypothetical protein